MSNLPPLNTETIWAILNDKIGDAIVNQLVWHYLGYRYDSSIAKWDNSEVTSEWRDDYPEPPDFIDSRPATVKLTRAIPKDNKQILKEKLGFKGYKIGEFGPQILKEKLGFKGYKIGEFGPRQTRRATAANWLLSYLQETQGSIE